jgi:cyclic pyranopterin phosphate synthase
MPEEGVKWMDHNHILSFEEIVDVVRVAVELGIDKIRLTGGEPLVRKGIVELVKMIAQLPGVKDLAMTTNGQQLAEYAGDLSNAGLARVNVSLDTLDAEKYAQLTRGADIKRVFEGIDEAIKHGMTPVKINCVIHDATTEEDKEMLKSFAGSKDLKLRFIRQMSLQDGSFYPVEGGDGGQCAICNRMRLTANGDIKPCLFSNHGYNVREYGARGAFMQAIGVKPETGIKNNVNHFYNVGG